MRLGFLAAVAAVSVASSVAAEALSGPAILERATEAAGGDAWANAKSLVLKGRAIFWGPSGADPRSEAGDYAMHREYDPARSAAHAAEGKVRIIANHAGKPLWTVGYDGQTTWTEKGITPAAEAEGFWASNFGFGIIRHAAEPGFKAERVADRNVGGHLLYMVRLTDPTGGATLFGMDQKSFAIRYMGFMTPRGWHERHYDDFIRLKDPDWLQARNVTLYYNGQKSNTVIWSDVKVNVAIDPALFAPPAGMGAAPAR